MSSVRAALSAETRPVRCSIQANMSGAPLRVRDDHAIRHIGEVLHPLDFSHSVLRAERHGIESARRRTDVRAVWLLHVHAELAELRTVARAQKGFEAVVPIELALQVRADRAEHDEAQHADVERHVAARCWIEQIRPLLAELALLVGVHVDAPDVVSVIADQVSVDDVLLREVDLDGLIDARFERVDERNRQAQADEAADGDRRLRHESAAAHLLRVFWCLRSGGIFRHENYLRGATSGGADGRTPPATCKACRARSLAPGPARPSWAQ